MRGSVIFLTEKKNDSPLQEVKIIGVVQDVPNSSGTYSTLRINGDTVAKYVHWFEGCEVEIVIRRLK